MTSACPRSLPFDDVDPARYVLWEPAGGSGEEAMQNNVGLYLTNRENPIFREDTGRRCSPGYLSWESYSTSAWLSICSPSSR